MSNGLILDNITMNLISDITKQTTDSSKKDLFSKIQDDRIYFYKGPLKDYSWKKRISDTKKTLSLHHFIEKDKLRKYMSDMLSMDHDEEDLEKKKNQFINDIRDFNNKHIIQCYKETISNIPEKHVTYHP